MRMDASSHVVLIGQRPGPCSNHAMRSCRCINKGVDCNIIIIIMLSSLRALKC